MHSLPVVSIVRDALRGVFKHRLVLFRTLLGPALLLAANDTYQVTQLGEGPDISATLQSLLFYFVVVTLFAVCTHRVILMGDDSVPKFGLFRWTMRETRFLGWTLLIGFCMALIPLSVGAVAAIANGALDVFDGKDIAEIEFNPFSVSTLVILPLLIPAIYIPSRWALLLPATAVGERHGIRWAWQATEYNGWRMVALVVILPVLLAFFPAYEVVQFNVALGFLANLASYVLLVIEIAVLSLAYRFLVTPGDGAAQ